MLKIVNPFDCIYGVWSEPEPYEADLLAPSTKTATRSKVMHQYSSQLNALSFSLFPRIV